MKTIRLFLGLAPVLVTLHTHAQPQWRFHLAFEDAIGAKDTLWFIYDETATLPGVDTHLGEGPLAMDPGVFNVWTGNYAGELTKTVAWPYSLFPLAEVGMEGSGYAPPLTLRWDTMLFLTPYLPNTPSNFIRYPRLCGYQIIYHGIESWGGTGCFNMFHADSIVLVAPPLESIFSLTMIFDYHDPTGTSIGEHSLPSLDIFPNPTTGLIQVQLNNALRPRELFVSDALGREVLRQALPNNTQGLLQVDLGMLSPGDYLLTLLDAQGMRHVQRVVRE